ncbi:hypothetical protein ABT104_32555 [Streptomyces mobaraensis]|uniref:terpene synthase family protein n=1 Tax=Streptomyces mobaraensis TaxID=35621 RepID=UPI00333138C1
MSAPELPPCPGLTAGQRLRLPLLSQRFECSWHPGHQELRRWNTSWIVEELYEGDYRRAVGMLENATWALVAMGFPQAPHENIDRLKAVCDLSAWWFDIDDEIMRILADSGTGQGQRRGLVRSYSEKVWGLLTEGRPVPGAPWNTDAVREMASRLMEIPGFGDIAHAAFTAWQIDGHKNEADGLNTSDDVVRNFLRMRASTGACHAYELLTESILGIRIPQEVKDRPVVAAYREAIEDTWVLPNDLLSSRRECFQGDHDGNIVCLLRRLHGLSLQGAVDEAARLLMDRHTRALSLFEKALAEDGEETRGLRTYLKAFQHIGAANQRWSYMTPRYHGSGFYWNGVLSGELILETDCTVFPPVEAVG